MTSCKFSTFIKREQHLRQKNCTKKRMKLYNKWDFQARAVRKTAVYMDVNEDFSDKRNTKITLLDSFTQFLDVV